MQTNVPMSIILVPGWIHSALLRNGLSVTDTLDYTKVRKVISLDDMIQWFAMNDSLKLHDCSLSNVVIENMWTNFTEQGKKELYNTVLAMSGNDQVKEDITKRLSKTTDSFGNPLTQQPFQFVRVEHILYIVLSEGFIASTLDEKFTVDFVKKYLKECYAMASVAEVSKLDMFKLYLQLIA